MARCKICKTNIPDGIEYCEDCQDKRSKVSNESYLDSLLNSVKTTAPSAENIYKKKRVANSSGGNRSSLQLVQDNLDDMNNIEELYSPGIAADDQAADDWQDYTPYPMDLSDLEDFDNYDLGEDLRDIEIETVISDEELFGEDISQLLYGHEEAAVKRPGTDETGAMAKAAVTAGISGEGSGQGLMTGSGNVSEIMAEQGTRSGVTTEPGTMAEVMTGTGTMTEVMAEPGTMTEVMTGTGTMTEVMAEPGTMTEVMAGSGTMTELLTEPGTMAEAMAGAGAMPELLTEAGSMPELMTEPETMQETLADKASEGQTYDGRHGSEEKALEEGLEDQELQSDLAELLAGTFNDGESDEDVDQHSEDNQLLEEIPELEAEDFDPDLNELLDSLSTAPDDYTMDQDGQSEDMELKSQGLNPQELELREEAADAVSEAPKALDEAGVADDDFLSLLNQIASDDPVSEDVRAINDLLQGKPVEPPQKDSMPSNVGEVFSDALRGISSLSDLEAQEEEALSKVPDKKGKKAKKEKKAKRNEASDGEKPKKSLLQLLFGNVKNGKAKKKAAVSEAGAEKADELAEAPPQTGKVKKAKGKAGEEPEETGAGKKTRKGKKGASAAGEEEEGSKGKAAKVKKEKKQKKNREIIQVIDDIEEDEGRINRLGATIVFIFFGLLATLVLVGTNMVSYTLSIEKATNYFDGQKYTEAYNEVYGMEIKDEDIAIYDKIMTVMYVNKQLNSYNNYYSVKDYPQALDSLLKGLRRYDKYIELATLLGIESDLKYVREQILAELDNEFKLSEKQAMKIISYDNMEKYSLAVYDVVDNNINN